METPLDVDAAIRIDYLTERSNAQQAVLLSLASGTKITSSKVMDIDTRITKKYRSMAVEARWKMAETRQLCSIHPLNLWSGDSLLSNDDTVAMVLPLMLVLWKMSIGAAPASDHALTYLPYFTMAHNVHSETHQLSVLYGISIGLYGHGPTEITQQKKGRLPTTGIELWMIPHESCDGLRMEEVTSLILDNKRPLSRSVRLCVARPYWHTWKPTRAVSPVIHDLLDLEHRFYKRVLGQWAQQVAELLGLTAFDFDVPSLLPFYNEFGRPSWIDRLQEPSVDLYKTMAECTSTITPQGDLIDVSTEE